MKIRLTHLLLLLLIINMAVIIVLANFKFLVFDESYYKGQFNKNKVYSKMPEADLALKDVFLFFKGEESELKSEIFTLNEREHLKDVKTLIKNFFFAFYYSIYIEILLLIALIILILKKNHIRPDIKHKKSKTEFLNNILNVIIGASFLVISFSLLLFFISAFFSELFYYFHFFFFPQGNWIFPYDSALISLFPQDFFFDIFYQIFLNSFAVSIVLAIFSIFTKKVVLN